MSGPPPLSATWQQADELRAQGAFAAARDLLEPAADVAAIRLGPDDRAVVETQRRLATVHRELGELASARRVLEEALDGGLLGLGDADPLILSISAELGAIADELGNKHEARRNLARVARFGPAVLGADHPYVRTAQRYLGVDAPLPAAPAAPWTPVEPGVYRSTGQPAATPPGAVTPPEAPPAPPAPPDAAYRAQPDTAHRAQPDPAQPWPGQPSTALVPTTAPLPPPAGPGPSPQPFEPSQPFPPAQPLSALPVPVVQPAGWPPSGWDEPAPEPRQPPRRSRRGWWIALVAVLAVALTAGVVVAVIALAGRPGQPGTGLAPSPSPAARAAPRDVRLRDNGVSVTLTWTDPTSGSVPFLIAGGLAGEQLRAFQSLPAGQTAYTLNGLNPTVDYCFTVVAAYDTNTVATSDPVCTDRRHEPAKSPGASPSR